MTDLVDLATEEALAALPGDVWLPHRSWTRPDWTVDELMAAKAERTISVVLPALNEEDTIETVIDSISPLVGGLVEELIVLDSGSTDDTEIRAIAAGARMFRVHEIGPTRRVLEMVASIHGQRRPTRTVRGLA